MPLKQCPSCPEKSGPRTMKCKCGHEFIKGDKVPAIKQAKEVKVETVKPEPVKEPTKKSIIASRLYGGTYTPSGACPVKPKIAGDIPTDDEIVSWAYDVVDAGIEKEKQYLPEAIVYFAREFCDINSPDFKRVSNVITNAFRHKEVVDN